MSRLRDFPKTVCMARNRKTGLFVVMDAIGAETLQRIGEEVKIYVLTEETTTTTTESKPKRRRKTAKTPADMPAEEDNQPQGQPEALSEAIEVEPKTKPSRKKVEPKAEKAGFHCTNCNTDIEKPRTTAAGGTQCPNCLKIGTIESKE